MTENDSGITADELAKWMLPKAALDLTEAAMGSRHRAADAIVKRLVGGLIPTAVALAVQKDFGRETSRLPNHKIPHAHWSHLSGYPQDQDFWSSADAELWHSNNRLVLYYGLRFEPDSVKNWIASLGSESRVSAQAAPALSSPKIGPDQLAPALPQALLKAWFDLFKRTYKDTEITEAKAMQSVLGMFPDHSVTRKRVRALLPERRRGRPVKDGDESALTANFAA